MKEQKQDIPGHEHDFVFVEVREYEVYRCHGCEKEQLRPIPDGWQEK